MNAIGRRLLPVLLASALQMDALAAPGSLPSSELLPVVPGPPETRSTPFIAWFMNLARDGYVEEEYAVSGMADIYGYVNDSAAVEVIEPYTPYTTRILVRKPRRAKDFNGTVYYEVLNATAGWDGDPIWQSTFDYMTREGAVWVGMSTKPVTVDFLRDGWSSWPLAERNGDRYSSLAMPAFGQVWDMLSQTALLLKTPDASGNPLAGYDVKRIIMVGYSQSAAYQVTYVNSFHELATTPDGEPLIDGYFISAGGDNAKHVTGPTDGTPENLADGDPRNFLYPNVPTMRFQTQTEVVNFPSYTVRQSEADNRWLRFYEMAGGSHVDARINEVGGQALVRDLGLAPSFCPDPAVPYNPVIIGDVQSALLDRLDQWVASGKKPPASRFMELTPAPAVSIVLDADGNAVGGIRPPLVQVPLGAYLPTNTGPGFCFLFGGFEPFSDAQLSQRYRNHGAYISKMTRAIKRSQREGFLLREEARRLRREAVSSGIGK